MTGIKITGRLGNQMFQYAFIHTVSKNLNTRFYLDQYDYTFVLHKYFNIKLSWPERLIIAVISINGFKSFFNFHFRRLFFRELQRMLRLKIKNYDWKETDANEVLDNIQNGIFYTGYFQSPLYFKKHEIEIRRLFSLKPGYQKKFRDKYNYLYNSFSTVCIHIRRTDFLTGASLNLGDPDHSLPLSYYRNVIALNNSENIIYVFISDDVDFVTRHFADIENKFISNDAEIMDFQHMLNADVCVISNSTFSWWGAWLNETPGKIVYAPKYYQGWRLKKEIPVDIYPNEWIQIDF